MTTIRIEPPIIDLKAVFKKYDSPSGTTQALNGVEFQVQQGQLAAIVGRSGSGKSTLLNIVAGIDRPTSGQVFVAGTAVHTLTENRLAGWRGRHVGVVFQFFQLLPTLTVAENVALPMDFCGTYPTSERRLRALALLDRVGIADQSDKLPLALSGGQQQRAAIARALANDPPVLVADEPTGNLDSRTGQAVWELFRGLADDGKTVVVVTHDPEVARWGDRIIRIADGVIVANDAVAYRQREVSHA